MWGLSDLRYEWVVFCMTGFGVLGCLSDGCLANLVSRVAGVEVVGDS